MYTPTWFTIMSVCTYILVPEHCKIKHVVYFCKSLRPSDIKQDNDLYTRTRRRFHCHCVCFVTVRPTGAKEGTWETETETKGKETRTARKSKSDRNQSQPRRHFHFRLHSASVHRNTDKFRKTASNFSGDRELPQTTKLWKFPKNRSYFISRRDLAIPTESRLLYPTVHSYQGAENGPRSSSLRVRSHSDRFCCAELQK